MPAGQLPSAVNMLTRGCQISFDYVNHAGKDERRHVTFDRMEFITNAYYPTGALCLAGTCKDRKAYRSFDTAKIRNFKFGD